MVKMKTKLDMIPSTITIPMGLKNQIRKLKGTMTYEDFLSKLLRNRNDFVHSSSSYIEVQKFDRKNMIYSFDDFKVVFAFNKYNHSKNFVFDIGIKNLRESGKPIFEIELITIRFGKKSDLLKSSYVLYFELLTLAIQNEINPRFKHKGRFEDYDSWMREFEELGLSKKSFDNDVMEKLDDYLAGVHYR